MFCGIGDHEVKHMKGDMGVPLSEFIKGKSQAEVAEIIGVTQGAVSQMLRSKRDIRVRRDARGSFEAVEIKVVGARHTQRAA